MPPCDRCHRARPRPRSRIDDNAPEPDALDAAALLGILERLIDARIDARLAQPKQGPVDRETEGSYGPEGDARSGDGRLLTVPAVAKALSLSRSTVYELIRRGDIAAVRVGGARRVRPEAVETFRSSLTDAPRRSPGPSGSGGTPPT